MDANFGHAYCRNLLRLVMVDVKKHVPIKLRKAAWTYNYGRCKEFQITTCPELPKGFYWYGRACCCWEARVEGWTAYLAQMGIEGYKPKEEPRC